MGRGESAGIYVASSWKNERQPRVVERLRSEGFDVYDFRSPARNQPGFSWKMVDSHWEEWSPWEFREALEHPIARRGFQFDIDALSAAVATVLVLPCGRSAHLELGFAAGRGQRTFVLAEEQAITPELMYRMCTRVCLNIDELVESLRCP